MFFKVFPDIIKSQIKELKLGNEIIGINNFPIKNFEINAFSSILVISLNFCLIKIEMILQIYLIELGNKKVLLIKSSINCSIKDITSKKSF